LDKHRKYYYFYIATFVLTSFPRKTFPLLIFQNSHAVHAYFVAAQAPPKFVIYI